MHKESIGNNVFSYFYNGKLYATEVDWETELDLEESDIINELFNNSSSVLYQNEEFKQFFNEVFYSENGIEKLLDDSDERTTLYRTHIELALLKFGSYEFISTCCNRKIFKNSTKEQRELLFKKLDSRIKKIQRMLIEFSKNPNNSDYIEEYTRNSRKLYLNYLRNYAPQRLKDYTETSIDVQLFQGIMQIKELSLQELAYEDLFDESLNFENIYDLSNVLNIVKLYVRLKDTKTVEERENIFKQIDMLTLKGISMHGLFPGLTNLINTASINSICKVIDNIPIRINMCDESEKADISEELNLISRIVRSLSNYNREPDDSVNLLSSSIFFNKLIQISKLGILSEEDQSKLNKILNDSLMPETIKVPDMSAFDEYINSRNRMPDKEAKEFFNSTMKILLKDGLIPSKYSEYLIIQLLDVNSFFYKNINAVQRTIIMENFARNRAKSLCDKDIYISYSTNLKQTNTVGEHTKRCVRLLLTSYDIPLVNTVVDIVTMHHELRHEQQSQSMDDNNNDYLTYMMIKEKVLSSDDYNFYNRNYDYMYNELDAEYFGLKATINFIKSLASNNLKNTTEYRTIVNKLEERKRSLEERFLNANIKTDKDGEKIEINSAVQQKIMESPELLEKYPVLQVEFNKDGSKKSLEQIFSEFTVVCREKNNRLGNYDLYKYVLLSNVDKEFDGEKLIIPDDLTPITKLALEKLKKSLINAREKIEDKTLELNENEKSDFENANENMDSETRKKYGFVLGDDSR